MFPQKTIPIFSFSSPLTCVVIGHRVHESSVLLVMAYIDCTNNVILSASEGSYFAETADY